MWLQKALAIEPTAESNVRAKALWGASGLAYHHGDYEEAETLSEELLPLARTAGEAVHMRNAFTIRGVVAMTQGRFSDAVEPLQQALDICRELGPSWLLGTSHLNLGSALMHAGDADSGSHFEDAMKVYRDIGDENFASRATEQLGYPALQAGDKRQARSLFATALEAYRDLDDRWGLAEALEGFSALNAASGNHEAAARLAGAAETLRDSFGVRPLPADRVSIERYLTAARASVDEDVWRSAWHEGRSLPLDKAIDQALQTGG
jgi:tetratricopeptide (TPR) repeat protein